MRVRVLHGELQGIKRPFLRHLEIRGCSPFKASSLRGYCGRNKDTDLLENGLEDMGRGKGKL